MIEQTSKEWKFNGMLLNFDATMEKPDNEPAKIVVEFVNI